jgi:hypothetical protein
MICVHRALSGAEHTKLSGRRRTDSGPESALRRTTDVTEGLAETLGGEVETPTGSSGM